MDMHEICQKYAVNMQSYALNMQFYANDVQEICNLKKIEKISWCNYIDCIGQICKKYALKKCKNMPF